MTMIKTLLSVIALTTTVDAAFVPASSAPAFSARHTVRESAVQPLNLFDSNTVLDTASNMWLATIDADIAAIPDNEFAPIFMGGIVSCYFYAEMLWLMWRVKEVVIRVGFWKHFLYRTSRLCLTRFFPSSLILATRLSCLVVFFRLLWLVSF